MNITITYGSGNMINRTIDGPLTVGQAISQFRTALGYGQNVEGHLDGVPQGNDIHLQDGDELAIHDKACAKAADPAIHINVNGGTTVTLIYGSGNEKEFIFADGTTLQTVLADKRVQAALGYGSNVEGFIDGVPQPPATALQPGDKVEVHDKACAKASR